MNTVKNSKCEVGSYKMREKSDSVPKMVGTVLIDQYMFLFGTKYKENANEIFNLFGENAITDVDITENDTDKAIYQLKKNSASGSDEAHLLF